MQAIKHNGLLKKSLSMLLVVIMVVGFIPGGFFAPVKASAATYTATNHASLVTAIGNAAASGDTVQINNDITLTSTITISNKSINFRSGTGGPFTITAASGVRHFVVIGSGGTITTNFGTGLTHVDRVILDGGMNAAKTSGGGGIYTSGAIDVRLQVATIKNCYRVGNGGAMETVSAGTINLDRCLIEGNFASSTGAGIYLGGYTTTSSVIDSTMRNNICGGTGGGIAVAGTTVTFSGTNTITNNEADHGAGLSAGAAAIINGNLYITNNKARVANGGAQFTDGATLIGHLEVSGNEAGGAGGFLIGGIAGFVTSGSSATLAVTNNKALAGSAAGIRVTDTSKLDLSSISSATISNNTATSDGGGVYAVYTNLMNIKIGPNVIFSNNIAGSSSPRATADDALYAANIKTTNWTAPFTQGYNNFDISYKATAATFNSNGGSAVATQYLPPAGGGVLKPADPMRSMHIFDGWYLESTLTTPVVWVGDLTYTITGSRTFYAKWHMVETTTFAFNGADESGTAITTPAFVAPGDYVSERNTAVLIPNSYFPQVSNHTLIGYKLNGGATQPLGAGGTIDLAAAAVNAENIAVTLVYRRNYVDITVRGFENSTSGTALYSYTYKEAYNTTANSASVTGFTMPNYRFATTTEVAGNTSTRAFTPNQDTTIDFIYKSLATKVNVVAYVGATGTTVPTGFTAYKIDAIAGTTDFNTKAPTIAGYTLLSAPSNITVAENEASNTLVFRYEAANQNLLIKAVDKDDTSNVIGHYYQQLAPGETFVSSDTNAPTSTQIPDLENWTLVASSGSGNITNTGADNLTVTYKYARKTTAITLVAYNTVTDAEITGNRVNIAAQNAGSVYDYSGDLKTISGYTIVPISPTTVKVPASGPLEIKVYYTPNLTESMPVEVHAGSATGDLLTSYCVPAATGQTIDITGNLPSIAGYSVLGTNGTNGNVWSAVQNGTNKLIVVMKDDRSTVTVTTKLGTAGATTHSTYKFVNPYTTVIDAPHVNGHVLMSYQVDGGAVTTTPPINQVQLNGLSADKTVQFNYITTEDFVNLNMLNVVVQGRLDSATGTELYSYTIPRFKNSGTFTVSPLTVLGYNLNSALSAPVPRVISVGEMTPAPIIFVYNDIATTVEIRAYLEGTSTPVPGFTWFDVAARTGQTGFNHAAPTISGYQNVAPLPSGITVPESGGYLNFYYRPITGNVLIEAVEYGTGAIIGYHSASIATGETFTASAANAPSSTNIPGLVHYTLRSPGTGTPPSVSYDGVTAPGTVRYYYDRNVGSIKLLAYNAYTNTYISGHDVPIPNLLVNKGHDYSTYRVNIPGYTMALTNNTIAYVPDTNVVEIHVFYNPNPTDTLSVEVRLGSNSGPLIQSYGLPVAIGQKIDITNSLPSIAGYSVDSTHPHNMWVVGSYSPGNRLMVIMIDQRNTVTVNTKLGTSAVTMFSETQFAAPYTTTVNAPYMGGFVLKSYQVTPGGSEVTTGTLNTVLLNSITGNRTVQFNYIPVEDWVSENFDTVTVPVTISGIEVDSAGNATGKILYSYTIREPFGTTAKTATSNVVPKYRIYGSNPITQNPDTYTTTGTYTPTKGTTPTVIFKYETNMTTVTVRAYGTDGATALPTADFTPYTISVEAGKPIGSYLAPAINNYQNTGAVTAFPYTAPADGSGELKFKYQKVADANYKIIAKEAGTGTLIGFVPQSMAIGGSFTASVANAPTQAQIPDLKYYNAPASAGTPGSVGYPDSLNPPQDVTYEYARKTRTVTIEQRAEYDNDLLLSSNSAPLPVGTYQSVGAPIAPAGYYLVGATAQTVYVDMDAASIVLTFLYKPLVDATAGITVKAVWMDGSVKKTITSYTVVGVLGSNITAVASDIAGWVKPAVTTKSGVFGTATEIEFIYTKDQVEVLIQLKDNKGNTLTAPAGYETSVMVQKDVVSTILPAAISGYVLQAPYNYTQMFFLDPTTVTFTYVADNDFADDKTVIITVVGRDAASNPLYLVPYRVLKTGGDFIANAITFPGLKVIKAELGITDKGAVTSVTVDPASGNQTVTFFYASNTVDVSVVLKNRTDNSVIQTIIVPNVEKGKQFDYTSPALAGYQLVAESDGAVLGNYIDTIANVSDADKTLTFWYAAAVGNLRIVYEDSVTHEVLGYDYQTLPIGVATAVNPARTGIPYYNNSATVIPNVTFTGAALADAKYMYVRKTADVKLIAVDRVTGNEISGKVVTIPAKRVGETLDITGEIISSIAGYTLIAPGLTNHIVSEVTAENRIIIYYEPAKGGVIPVELRAEQADGELLQSYTVPAASDEKVTCSGSQIPDLSGMGFNYNDSLSKVSATEGVSGDKIILVYTDVRKTITVVTDPAGHGTTYKVVSGSGQAVAVPYIAGYVLDLYSIDYANDIQTDVANADGAGKATIDLSNIEENVTVTVKYITLQDYIDRNFAVITVIASDGSNVLSSAAMQAQIGGDVIVTAPAMPGWTLDTANNANYENGDGTGAFGKGTVDTSAAGPYNYTFYYIRNTKTVQVNALLDGTPQTQIGGYPQTYTTAVKGAIVSVNAPAIPGYALKGGEAATKTHTVGDTDNTVTFVYVRSNGNVAFEWVDATGVVLVRGSAEAAVWSDTADVTVPAVSIPTGWALKYGIGDPSYSHAQVQPNGTVVTLTLVKVLKTITVNYVKKGVTPEETVATATTVASMQVGTVIDVIAAPADLESHWVLSGQPYKNIEVSADDADNKVTFEYVRGDTVSQGTLTTIATYDGKLVYMGTEQVTVGETYGPVAIPTVVGYKNGELDSASDPVTGTMTAAGATVVFKFKELDTVDVKVYVKDTNNKALTGLTYEDDTNNLFVTLKVQKGSGMDAVAPHVDSYVLQSGNQIVSISVADDGTATPASATFVYETAEDYVDSKYAEITIRGITGGVEHYSYVRRFAKSATPVDLMYGTDLFAIPGYKLADGQTLSVIPDGSAIIATFNYVSNISDVKIQAMYEGTTKPVEAFTPIHVNAEIGKAFAFTAPYIAGFNNTGAAPAGGVIASVNETDNTITFYYTKGAGDLTVIAKEGDTIIGQATRKIAIGTVPINQEPGTGEIPALAHYDYTGTPGTASPATYDGVTPVTVEYQYTRKTAGITLIAKNTVTDDEIARVNVSAQRVLAEYNLTDDLSALDSLVLAINDKFTRLVGETSVWVSVDPAQNQIIVWYVPAQNGKIPVEIRLDSQAGELLQSYFVPAAADETVSLSGSQIPNLAGMGYSFNQSKSTISATEGTGEKLVLVYDDMRLEITVYIVKGSGAAELYETKKVVAGNDAAAYAPYLAGWVLKEYEIDTEGKLAVDASFSNVILVTISGSQKVTFYYQNVDEYVNDEYVSILVRGIDKITGKDIYSHVVTARRSDAPMNINAFDVAGYTLTSDPTQTVVADGSRAEVVFEYVSNATYVTVKAELGDGTPVAVFTNIYVPAQIGQPLSYNAPYIPGYVMVGNTTQTIASVAAGDVITFTYEKAVGNLTILLREDDAGGKVIKALSQALEQDVATAIPVPDLSSEFYTAISVAKTVTYEGQALTVEYYYTKQTRTVTVEQYDTTNNAVLDSYDIGDFRIGEVLVLNAPAYDDYKLTSANPIYVLIENGAGGQTVRFTYETKAGNEIVVNAIDTATRDLLYSYTLTGTPGELKTVNAPIIIGFRLVAGQLVTVETTVSDVIEFLYETDADTYVNIHYALQDKDGNALRIPSYIPLDYTAVKGTNYTAYAPHIPGYTVVGSQSELLQNITQDQDVTFTYDQANEANVLTEVVVKYINKSKNNELIKSQTLTGYYVGQEFTANVPDAFNQGGRKYKLDGVVAAITLQETGNVVEAYYIDNGAENTTTGNGGSGGGGISYTTATLIVRGKDVKTGATIYNQSTTVVVGRTETLRAPVIEGYKLNADSQATQTITIKSGENLVVFNYDYTATNNIEKSDYTGNNVSDRIKETLETEIHVKYINGYPDGTVRPDGGITRAEVAMIFWRLMKDPAKNNAITSNFSDVAQDMWYTQAIAFLTQKGILTGYVDGTFKPGQVITRAEFAAIVSRFDTMSTGTTNPFVDVVDGYWAKDYIISAYVKGWISGYPGGEFKPGNAIVRGEVVTVINRVLGRALAKEDVPAELSHLFADLTANHWAFAAMIEASVEHEYEFKADGYEIWTDWTRPE